MQSQDQQSEQEPDEILTPLTTEEQAVLVAINPENELLYRIASKGNADDNNNIENEPNEVLFDDCFICLTLFILYVTVLLYSFCLLNIIHVEMH